MKTSTYGTVIALALAVAGAASAQIQGTVINTDGKAIEGKLRWKNSTKSYAVSKDQIDVEVPLANVREVQVVRPKDYDAALNLLQQGNPAGAVPLLEKVAGDYLMLQWDQPATRLLADAHLKAGDAEKALRVCEKIVNADPEKAYLGETAPLYWQALLKLDRKSKVEDLLAKAVKNGNRDSSAFALLMRGDLLQSAGDTNEIAKKALRDGYLRVVLLYRDVKAAQPEALYKAAKCFEKLGQTARADQMRTALKGSEFGASEWARKP